MMKKEYKIGVFVLLAMLLFGCGQAGDENAKETAGILGELSEKYDTLVENNQKANQKPYITDETRSDVDAKCDELFYYGQLDDEEKGLYQEIYTSIVTRQETAVSTFDTKLLDKVYRFVMNDHPEIFDTEGYNCTQVTRSEETVNLLFEANYSDTEEERDQKQAQVDAYVSTCLAGITPDMDDYSKVKYIYDYIIGETSYDLLAEDNQNICSVMIGHSSVCQGYAEATQYLLQKCDVPTTIVTGTANGSAHAWNLVQVDGAYYYLDTTWGDVDYQTIEGAEGLSETGVINYDYFLITTAQMEKTHYSDVTDVTLPVCDSIDANYFVKEGLMFTEFSEEMCSSKLKEIFQNASDVGKSVVTVKCANELVFDDMIAYLIDEKHIFDCVNFDGDISYAKDREIGTITVWTKGN